MQQRPLTELGYSITSSARVKRPQWGPRDTDHGTILPTSVSAWWFTLAV